MAPEELRQKEQVGGPVNCSDSELSIYLQALEAGFLATYYSDTSPFAQSKLMSIASRSYQRDKKTVLFHGFQSLQMSRNSTEDRGEELLTSYLAGFHVRRGATRALGKTAPLTFGRKCLELSVKYAPTLFSPKTLTRAQSSWFKTILPSVDIRHIGVKFQRQTWALTILGEGGGYLHTPTTKANYSGKSMQKWKCCRNFVAVFGTPTPNNQEFLMGWPLGWTDLQPLGMDKFQQWLRSHGKRL